MKKYPRGGGERKAKRHETSLFQSDMWLIGKKYLEKEELLNNDYQFLLKYFRKNFHIHLVIYYILFGYTDFFTQHTGIHMAKRYRRSLTRKAEKLIELRNKARDEFDLELLAEIESGKYKYVGW